MMGSRENLSFDLIRPWRGSQDRAFEELAYQLLQDEVPDGSTAIRTGNPDGGVEWYATAENGERWGWQVKNVKGIDDLLRGMTKSVTQVVKDHPDVVRLTFVIPKNLNTGIAAGKRISERKKYENKKEAWKRTIPGAGRIEFKLVQESDLLAKLALPQHRGRQKFWWNRDVFGPEWLRSKFDQQSIVAGKKYRPALQVDLPISRDLQALGLSQAVVDDFADLIKRTLGVLNDLGPITSEANELAVAWQSMCKSAELLASKIGSLPLLAKAIPEFDTWRGSTRRCLESIERVDTLLSDIRLSKDETLRSSAAESRERSLSQLHYELNGLRSSVTELDTWLSSAAGRAAETRLYFLTGSAGCGKTHLLLDSARVALEENRPALVLFGAEFGKGDFWQSICDQLGVEPLGRDVLLGAMETAAEAANFGSGRFVIMVDALNETTMPGLWESYLPVLRSAIASYPRLALAVSCRDTYLEVVSPEPEREHFTQRSHPGFSGYEVEASEVYFNHYELEAPRIPLLVPEFAVPLFLRLYCESLKGEGSVVKAVGHEGRIAIFQRYLDAKVSQIARKAFPTAGSNYELGRNGVRVAAALDALLDGMAKADTEWLRLEEAETLASSALEGDADLAIRIIGQLEDEGVLSRTPLYLEGQGEGTGIRVLFQAFSDFLILKRRINTVANPQVDPEVREWLLGSASLGVLEAASILIPESLGVELPDFLDLTLADLYYETNASALDFMRPNRVRQVYWSLFDALPYRTSSSINQRTLELIDDALASVFPNEHLYPILFMTAPQPNNLLNGDGLHRHLTNLTMPKRDASFGFAVYGELSDESSPVVRLSRWAALGPYPDYPNETIELSAIPLCWLLSSPNRVMRDWVTKALVQLLHGHLDVMQALFERFWTVDDPYVVQRVVAIAYGCVMRGGRSNSAQAKGLANSILTRVFDKPMRPDELMLDAARGIVEWAVAHDLLPIASTDTIKRPYGLKLPGNPPAIEKIKASYRPKMGQRADKSYASIYEQVFYTGFYDTGNFGRRTVIPDISWFSRYPIGKPKPKVKNTRPRSRPFQYDVYPADRALRWIFMRALSRGWSPEVFGVRDRVIGYRDTGHDSAREESWGKKYLWMAFHEFLARVADNYQSSESDSEAGAYNGLQQMRGTREIDPSLPPVNIGDLPGSGSRASAAWPASRVPAPKLLAPKLDFSRFRGEITALLEDSETEPRPSTLTSFVTDGSARWIALHGVETQREHENQWNVMSLVQQTWVRSFLIRQDHERCAPVLLKKIWREENRRTELLQHVDCCYAGEIGWSLRPCPDRPTQPRTFSGSKASIEGMEICESYVWEGNVLDGSLTDTMSATMPSRFVQKHSGLEMLIAGPTWLDGRGESVAVYQDFDARRGNALFARVDWLTAFLKQTETRLVVLVQFDRLVYDPSRTERYPRLNGWSAATIGPGGRLTEIGRLLTRKEMW